MCRILLSVLFVILLMHSSRVHGTDVDPVSQLENTKQEYLTLDVFVRPSKGIARSEVEKVYGTPTKFAEKAKGPTPYFVYDLKTADTNLFVGYEDDKVKWSRVQALPLADGMSDSPSDDEMLKAYIIGIARLRVVRATFWDLLRLAPWNRR